jgi:hypothetical protein
MTRQGIDSDRQRIYAIGDIHGRLDLLERAIEAIGRDVAERGPAALTITIGDYIDRGPQSRGVVDRLIDNPFPTQFVALKGNHEEMLEAFVADPAAGPHWAADDTKKHPCGCYCLPHICASGCSCRKSNAGPASAYCGKRDQSEETDLLGVCWLLAASLDEKSIGTWVGR